VKPKHVKALYRRGQALLEDGREGLPEASLHAALDDFRAACELEPGNAQVASEAERVERQRRLALERQRLLGQLAQRAPCEAPMTCEAPRAKLSPKRQPAQRPRTSSRP